MKTEELFIGDEKIHVTAAHPEVTTHDQSLVLVHGSWGGGWMWKMYQEFFTAQGWDVYALDLRGHGKSGGSVEGALMENYVDDVHVVVEEIGLDHPVIIGHSMGGLVALMYGASHHVSAVVSVDGSPSIEVQKESKEVVYPAAYTPMEAGMPADPQEVMMAFPDLMPEQLMMMKDMFGPESGAARSQRKLGVSVPQEALTVPLLFVGAENGESVPFGIGIEKATAMAEYYDGDLIEIKGATHPGILVGKQAMEGARVIADWLAEIK